MQIDPSNSQTPNHQPQKKGKFEPLNSTPHVLQMALKASKTTIGVFKNVHFVNPNIQKKTPKDPPEKLPKEENLLKKQIETALKHVIEEPEEPHPFEHDPFVSMNEGFQKNMEEDLLNEILFRIEKGFLALQINDHEIFSESVLENLLRQIPNLDDRKELLLNSTLQSFSHMAVNQDGEENIVHILELATPPQKIMMNLPHLYIVKWQIYPEGVTISKESEYTLVTPMHKDHVDQIIPLYRYKELIDFRKGQEKHHIEIEPSQKGFDPVNHRLIWNF